MPAPTISADQAYELIRSSEARLIAVDGLPCSGKSTLVAGLGIECMPMDDFFLPPSEWPSGIVPAFPFPFYRYQTFLSAVEKLAVSGSCEYLPFEWERMEVSQRARRVDLAAGPVVVEGTSSLHPRITPLYDCRFFVESHEATVLQAVLERDGDYFENEWRTLWLPSTAIYMETNPRSRADFLIAGRGMFHE